MNPFIYQRVQTADEGLLAVSTDGAKFLGGGTNLVDLMKGGVEQPTKLVDVTRLNLTSIRRSSDGSIMIEAGVSNSAVANNEIIRTHYPMLSQAILSGASTQLRNMATTGGNLVQRTRCSYFMDPSFDACNKRKPGSGCTALKGFNRGHAILGASESCVAINPSDMGVALAALGAIVHIRSRLGKDRSVKLEDFYRLPGATPHIETQLVEGELIIGVELPKSRFSENSWYLKVRDRHSYAFALVSTAAGLKISGGVIQSAGLALGGVAPKPWRLFDVEAFLAGAEPRIEVFREAAEIALRWAKPLKHNTFKVDLAKHSVVRSLTLAARGTPKP